MADFVPDHQYQLMAGSWATAMAVAMRLMWRDPFMTAAMKVVQARIAASASVVLLLLASAAGRLYPRRAARRLQSK
jgi:hypothetical protein